jgi:hypothetical protein
MSGYYAGGYGDSDDGGGGGAMGEDADDRMDDFQSINNFNPYYSGNGGYSDRFSIPTTTTTTTSSSSLSSLHGGHNKYDLSDSISSSSSKNEMGVDSLRNAESLLGTKPRQGDQLESIVEGIIMETDSLKRRLNQQSLDKQAGIINGFVQSDGTIRNYEAPAPPTDVDFSLLKPLLQKWYDSYSIPNAHVPHQDLLNGEIYILLPDKRPGSDFTKLNGVIHGTTEFNKILKPFSISRDDNGRPFYWNSGVERDLRSKGIKLADSKIIDPVLDTPSGQKSVSFGLRFFHVGYRYFSVVVLHGEFEKDETESFKLDDKKFVGFYYISMSPEQAQLNRCI